ncbi:hypothetical protein ISREJYDI_CDS0166 [Pseudomonas phage UNO-G1W1]|uniref:DUF7296 domain-containing protein n=1 Tax=Pseudomonas phage UNO-G1W1 TaxID=3136609 RepID=A0AAX4MV89_9CAUD
MLPVHIEGSLWYEFDQNNSGGYFERDDFVSDVVFVQAMNAEQAEQIMTDLIDKAHAWNYCECCGERWYFGYTKGYDVPTRYGKPVTEGVDLFGSQGYILFHGLNGRTLKWSGKLNESPTEIGRIEAGE